MSLTPTLVARASVQLTTELTAGPIFGNRIAIPDSNPEDDHISCFIASSNKCYEISMPLRGLSDAQSQAQGKCGVYIPQEALDATTTVLEPISFATPGSQIQSLTLVSKSDESRLLAADDRGFVSIASTSRSDGHSKPWSHLCALTPPGPVVQQGWAGCAVAAHDVNSVALARHLARDVQLIRIAESGPQLLWRSGCGGYPSAVLSLAGAAAGAPGPVESLVAVAEGSGVSLFDLRSGKQAQKLSNLSGSDLLALSQTRGHLGSIGRDRMLCVWDMRTWKQEDRTSHVVKFEATALHFSSLDPSLCFCAGLDYEVFMCPWRNEASRKRDRTHSNVLIPDGDSDAAAPSGKARPSGRAVGPSAAALEETAANDQEPDKGTGASEFAMRVSGRSMGLSLGRRGEACEVLASFNSSNVYFAFMKK